MEITKEKITKRASDEKCDKNWIARIDEVRVPIIIAYIFNSYVELPGSGINPNLRETMIKVSSDGQERLIKSKSEFPEDDVYIFNTILYKHISLSATTFHNREIIIPKSCHMRFEKRLQRSKRVIDTRYKINLELENENFSAYHPKADSLLPEGWIHLVVYHNDFPSNQFRVLMTQKDFEHLKLNKYPEISYSLHAV